MVTAHDVSLARPRMVDHPAGHARVMNDLSRSGLLTRELLGTYTLIAGYAGLDGECWTPQTTLATQLGCSVRTLQRDIDALVEIGCLTERVRRESRDGSRGRAYSLSDDWRAKLIDSHDTGVARLPVQDRSHTTPVPKSHDTGVRSHTTPVSSLKRTREKNPEKVVPVTPVLPAPESAADAAPAPTTSRVSVDASGRSAPPKSPARQRALTPDVQARVTEVWDYYRARIQPKARVYTASKIANRLRTFSVAEIKAGIDRFAADPWWMERCSGQGADWFFGNDAQVERWINLVPRATGATGGARTGTGARPSRMHGDQTFYGKPGAPIDADVSEASETWGQKEW